MIITKTAFRITLGGGGTALKDPELAGRLREYLSSLAPSAVESAH
jgi:hypothetical protein